MNGKRFFAILTVAAALTLFTSLAFGQANSPDRFPCMNIVTTTAAQVDELTAQADMLMMRTFGEIWEVANLCDDQRAIYFLTLEHVQSSRDNLDTARSACESAGRTHDGQPLCLALSEMAKATESLNKAWQFYFEAKDYLCS